MQLGLKFWACWARKAIESCSIWSCSVAYSSPSMEAKEITTNYRVSKNLQVGKHVSRRIIGTPLTDLPTLGCSKSLALSKPVKPPNPDLGNGAEPGSSLQSTCNSPAAITFVRNRMFYARPALNAKGRATFGLRHIREFVILQLCLY